MDPLRRSPEQDAVLDAALARAAEPGALCVFDLDGCLFDTRPRQVLLLRELASRRGWHALYRVREEHLVDWDLRAALLRAGLDPAWVERRGRAVERWWRRRFFSPRAVSWDHAMPGAAAFVRACAEAGARIAYLSGRTDRERRGTEDALRRFGFPAPPAAALALQEGEPQDNRAYKEAALDRIAELGRPVLFLDNEPRNVALFRERFPGALVVWVRTGHLPDDPPPPPGFPCIDGFLRAAAEE